MQVNRTSSCLFVGVALAFLVRGSIVLAKLDSLDADPDAYRVIAETLAQTGTFGLMGEGGVATPTAFRPPLYPWLLSFFVNADGHLASAWVAVLHVCLGVLTVGLTWDIARRWWSDRAAWIAAALVTVDPMLLWQSTLVMTETIATALTTLVWWWWVAKLNPRSADVPLNAGTHAHGCDRSSLWSLANAVVFGGLLSLTVLCRPTFLVWAAMLIPALFFIGPTCRVRRAARVGVVGMLLFATVGLWTLRNVSQLGHPVWATTHGGYTLLLANNNSFYDSLGESSGGWLPWVRTPWDPTEFFAAYEARERGVDEVSDDRVAYEMAKSTIANRPAMFGWSCVVRGARLWHPFPARTSDRSMLVVLVIGVYQTGLLFLAVGGIGKDWRSWRQSNAWPVFALILTLTAVHSVYWSNPRMRSPVIPMLAVAVACWVVPRQADRTKPT
ncbi:putative transmembrane protein [Rhodopirellula islandica]|uniref:Transmembrane protein n=1 Tax=Rhodopirellula islandica TaxID=595434 RepID=A0A0J1B3R8_RHOIS|nr:glycosyltransferase family 39 protein [Rhodopirellula islandica]KLU01263.1 putative transmembrane protein [Rhodopirellula islandica]